MGQAVRHTLNLDMYIILNRLKIWNIDYFFSILSLTHTYVRTYVCTYVTCPLIVRNYMCRCDVACNSSVYSVLLLFSGRCPK